MKKSFLPEFAALVLLNFAALYGFMIAMRALFETLFESSRFAPEVGAALSVLFLPPFFAVGGHFVYDLFTLFFFTASLAFLSRRRWIPFYIAIALGFINKETMCLIVIPFAVYLWDRLPRKRLLTHLGAQVILFAGLRLVIVLLLDPDRPTGPHDDFIRDYFSYNLIHAWNSRLLYDWVSVATIVGLVILVMRAFGRSPQLLRAGALMSLPLCGGFLIGGMWKEIRVFYEVFPIFFLLGYASSLEILGLQVRVRSDQEAGRLLGNRLPPDLGWSLAAVALGVMAMVVVYYGLAKKF
jgi:hypothetical protein